MVGGASTWSLEVAGNRECRPLGGAHPYEVFQQLEQDALLLLPRQPFEMVEWLTPTLGADCRFSALGAIYTAPHPYRGQVLDVCVSASTVVGYVNGVVVKTHPRQPKGGRSIDWSDYPPDKIAFFERTPVWCRKRAGDLGPSIAEVVNELLAVHVLHHLRSAQGIIRFTDRYGAERVNAACALALGAGDPTYMTIKGILQAGTDQSVAQEPSSTADVPAFLHGQLAMFEEAIS